MVLLGLVNDEATLSGDASHERLKVLIADDDANSASFMIAVVKRMGLQPIWVTDGNVAFRKAKELKPAAVLMDLLMPGLDGFVSLRLLRMNALTRDIPIIVISGLTAPQTPEKCRAEGAVDMLTKPVSVERLRDSLRTALGAQLPAES